MGEAEDALGEVERGYIREIVVGEPAHNAFMQHQQWQGLW